VKLVRAPRDFAAIIREPDGCIIMMIPLFCDWNVRRCNIKDCRNVPTTIVTGEDAKPAGIYGLCEEHFQFLSEAPGETTVQLVFDDFDAFKDT
jgi:hypothetical protein